MNCKKCGAENEESSKWCHKCGNDFMLAKLFTNKKSVIFLSFLILYIGGVIAFSGPSIICNENVDGDSLLSTLSDHRTSLENVSQNILQLASTCKPNKEQLELMDKGAGVIASDGSTKLQSDFYTKMSELIPNSQLRLDFINNSTFINGKSKSPSEQRHLVEVEQFDPANLVNFNKKDAADSELKTRLLSQGSKWKMSLLKKAVEPIDITEVVSVKTTDSTYEALSKKTTDNTYEVLSKLLNVATDNLANLKWLLSSPPEDTKFAKQLASLDNDIKNLQVRLDSIKPPAQPQEPPKSDYPYERVSVVISREIKDYEDVVRLPDRPFVYLGFIYGSVPPKYVILSSQKNLYPEMRKQGPVLNLVTMRGDKPMQYMFQGFTQDFWHYSTLSDDEELEYDKYIKQTKEYQNQLVRYNIFRNATVVESNAITLELGKLGRVFKGVVETAASR